jgi:hypothetical protein
MFQRAPSRNRPMTEEQQLGASAGSLDEALNSIIKELAGKPAGDGKPFTVREVLVRARGMFPEEQVRQAISDLARKGEIRLRWNLSGSFAEIYLLTDAFPEATRTAPRPVPGEGAGSVGEAAAS